MVNVLLSSQEQIQYIMRNQTSIKCYLKFIIKSEIAYLQNKCNQCAFTLGVILMICFSHLLIRKHIRKILDIDIVSSPFKKIFCSLSHNVIFEIVIPCDIITHKSEKASFMKTTHFSWLPWIYRIYLHSFRTF